MWSTCNSTYRMASTHETWLLIFIWVFGAFKSQSRSLNIHQVYFLKSLQTRTFVNLISADLDNCQPMGQICLADFCYSTWWVFKKLPAFKYGKCYLNIWIFSFLRKVKRSGHSRPAFLLSREVTTWGSVASVHHGQDGMRWALFPHLPGSPTLPIVLCTTSFSHLNYPPNPSRPLS